jgi:dienelactone hydrolase
VKKPRKAVRRTRQADDGASAALHRASGETRFSLLSGGDRVRGRIVRPAGRGPHPVVLVCGPGGSAESLFAEQAAAAWSGRAALVLIDLPLCGSRKSDKLSALALDRAQPLAQRLRAELLAQTAGDLSLVLGLVAEQPDLDAARVSLVGVGLGAELARDFAESADGLAHVELAPEVEPDAKWLARVGARVAP